MRHRHRVLTPLVLLLGLLAPGAGVEARRERPRCQEGAWVVDGGPLFPDSGGASDVLHLDPRTAAWDGDCGPATARVKRRGSVYVVKARWRWCGGRRLVRLRAAVDARSCARLDGTLRSREPEATLTFAATRAARALVYTRTAGFRHPSIADARRVLGALGPRDGVVATLTEDPTQFEDATLAGFDVLVFANTTGDILDDAQQEAVERFVRGGKGWVGVHSAADTEYGWPWYGRLVGAYFRNHPILPVTVEVATEDALHPSTSHLPATFPFTDEIYNFDRNPRIDNAILLTVDEAGFSFPNFPPGPSMGEDHPIAWYKEFEGGRSFYTNLGHRPESWDDPRFVRHLVEGIRWAARPAAWSRSVIADDARNPLSLAVTRDGRVYWTERTGELLTWDPTTGAARTAAVLPVDTSAENGLLGVAVDPGFVSNRLVYLYHSAPVSEPPPVGRPPGDNTVSRFVARDDGTLDLASRVDLLRVPSERVCCHEAGALTFGPDGTLFLSTGDNTNPFASDGRAPLDERPGREGFDSQRTAQNPFDLRGKILRINPDGSIPPGNLFPPDGSLGRPEIYTMGSRNPFRTAVDPATGRLWWGEVGPDALTDSPRGPRGYDEINFADRPGNYGWPWCIADNLPYADHDFATSSTGPAFVCDPFQPALLFYDYVTVSDRALGNAVNPEGGFTGRTAIAGAVYRRPSGAPFDLPEPFRNRLLMTDWTRDLIGALDVTPDDRLLGVRRLLPWERFLRPIDVEVGPDGALWVLEFGTGYFGDNPDARLTRIEWAPDGGLSPVAVLDASTAMGAAPLTVEFSGERSRAPGRGDAIKRWEWDLDGDGRVDASAPRVTRTYRAGGAYQPTLTVVAESGARSLPVSRRVVVGNAVPEVAIVAPMDGAVVPEGSVVRLRGRVADVEDGDPPCSRYLWTFFLGHNAHTHPQGTRTGCAIDFVANRPTDHGDAATLFFAVELSYADDGGRHGEPAATGRAGIRLDIGPRGSPSGAFLLE